VSALKTLRQPTFHISEGSEIVRRKNVNLVYETFIVPAFVLFTLFIIVPTISSAYYSFTSWDGINPAVNFIGTANFKEIFTSARFGNALKNTALLTVFISILENALALGLALLVDNVARAKNFFRAVFYIPVIISGIVSGFIWKIMFNYNFGPVNAVLNWLNLAGLQRDWLGSAATALLSVGVVLVWKGVGYYMIIYLAALQGVPAEVSEASTIDGAGALQRFRYITLPLISGAFTINFTLSLINGLKVFDQIAVMTDGGPGFSTETIVYLLYKVGFNEGRQGFGTAVGLVLLFIILAANTVQQKFLKKMEVQL
jgi:ABC-type sugar transport system permease subunit